MKLFFPVQQSGKIGTQVFQRNRQGVAARARVKPLNPKTNAQMGVRGIMGSMPGAFRGLTAPQRDAWNTFGPKLPNNLSGFNAFAKVNATLGFGEHTRVSRPATWASHWNVRSPARKSG